MRLLYWTPFYAPYIGGIETISRTLVGALRTRGYEVCIVTSQRNLPLPDEDEIDGVAVHRFPFFPALETHDPVLLLQTQRRLASLKREFKADVVHVNLSDPSVLFHLRTAAVHPSKFALTVHTTMPAEQSGPENLFGRALRAADWITTVSSGHLATLRRAVPEIIHRSSVIHYGFEHPRMQPGPLPTEAPRFLCLGRLDPVKGFDVAISAFASVADRWRNARLVIAGDGPERTALERLAGELAIADRIDFLGWVAAERVQALMEDATMVLMPSRREGLPLVAIEAAQMARPVVAARVGGLPEIIVDGETGLLFDQDDSAALARAMSRLLGDSKTAVRMGRAARERALDIFGHERHVTAYDHLYRHLTREAVQVDAREEVGSSEPNAAPVAQAATSGGF